MNRKKGRYTGLCRIRSIPSYSCMYAFYLISLAKGSKNKVLLSKYTSEQREDGMLMLEGEKPLFFTSCSRFEYER